MGEKKGDIKKSILVLRRATKPELLAACLDITDDPDSY